MAWQRRAPGRLSIRSRQNSRPRPSKGKPWGVSMNMRIVGGLYGMGFALTLLSWCALETALRALFASYMALAVIAVVMAWKQVPETRTVSFPQPGRQTRLVWPLVPVLLLALLSYLLTALLRPVFVVFLHDELTNDVRLLALAFVPAVLLESVLPSRLGHLSD